MAFTNPLIGKWTYRSFLNDPNQKTEPNDLLFGEGTIELTDAPMQQIAGTIGGDGWQLKLNGSMTYGNPFRARFEGKGTVNGEEWIYDYVGYLINIWPNGVGQVPAIVGSVIRTIPHSGGKAKAGFVASFYAVRQT